MTMTEPRQTDAALQIAEMSAAHLPAALRLSQQAGWPHRLDDWALTLSVSDGVVAMEGDAVVGTALCTVFEPVALLNMIIVEERMRGRGLGRRLMEAAMARAGAREMRLVATAEGIPLYEKLGFVACERILQHQGIARAAVPALVVSSGIAEDVARLAVMDQTACGLERTALLCRIASHGEVLLADDGFAMLREFGRGRVLGPVVARDAATAQALIAEGARRSAGSFLRIDLPEEHALGNFAAALGLAHAGGGTAMTRDPHRSVPGGFTTFALASQALG